MITFSLQEAYNVLIPLLVAIVSIAVYATVAYYLYRFIAKRDIFDLNLRQYNKFEHPFLYKFFAVMLYTLEYLFFFPLFLLFWLLGFTIILVAISRQPDIATNLLISMAIISSIRIISYFKQPLAREVAKLLPFALLAVFLIDISYFDLNKSLELIKQIPSIINVLVYYFIFVIILEFILRIVFSLSKIRLKEQNE